MNDKSKDLNIEHIISMINTNMDIGKKCEYLGSLPDVLSSYKDHRKFNLVLNSIVNMVDTCFYTKLNLMDYHGENIWKCLDFVFSSKKNIYSAKSPYFLSKLKLELSHEQIIILETKYKVNFNVKKVREILFEKNYKNYYLKEENLRESDINSLVDEIHDYIEKNKVESSSIETLYEKNNDLLLLNLKSFYSMKVSDKDLVATFDNVLKKKIPVTQKCELINNFVEIFKDTNIYKNSFGPLKNPKPAILKFFNKEIKKSLYETEAQSMINVTNRNLIYQNKEVIEYFINHPSFLQSNLQYKFERNQKLKVFNKLKLNEVEQNSLDLLNLQKNTKKVKI